ncbi:hypothetical protein GCM10008938_17110 [Deinococcus roseus]|uniref:Transposase n=1 Tax=Deinococcus roseus TaxID=392414 RepID=A0ABQ2D056_9DEIO|nr:hypothetical protein GCM10008938_17110 [Deinococcus roseus]
MLQIPALKRKFIWTDLRKKVPITTHLADDVYAIVCQKEVQGHHRAQQDQQDNREAQGPESF